MTVNLLGFSLHLSSVGSTDTLWDRAGGLVVLGVRTLFVAWFEQPSLRRNLVASISVGSTDAIAKELSLSFERTFRGEHHLCCEFSKKTSTINIQQCQSLMKQTISQSWMQ